MLGRLHPDVAWTNLKQGPATPQEPGEVCLPDSVTVDVFLSSVPSVGPVLCRQGSAGHSAQPTRVSHDPDLENKQHGWGARGGLSLTPQYKAGLHWYVSWGGSVGVGRRCREEGQSEEVTGGLLGC